MIESLQGGYQTQAVTYTAQGTRTRESSQKVSSPDTVSLSDGGKLMSSFFAGLGVDRSSGGPVSLDDLESALASKHQDMEGRINSLFLENGIATDPAVELTTDSEGRVRVKGDHPQKAEIEALFEENPDLSNDFRAVSGLSSMVEAGNEYSDFAAMYEKDPYGAIAQYGHLFSNLPDDEFSMTVNGASHGSGTEDNTMRVARPDFTNATRQDMINWVNSEVTSGNMTLDESAPFMFMTMKIDVNTGQAVAPSTDTQKMDFTKVARDGIEGALSFGDQDTAERLRRALDIMTG